MDYKWDDKYLLDIEEIDEQHRGFFELWDIVKQRKDLQEKEKLSHIIEQLEEYVQYHFKYEEQLLQKVKYNGFEEHMAEHRFFIQKVDEMKQELKYMNTLLCEKIESFMKKWFLSHIMQSDREYVQAVKNFYK
ncbi:MAG: hypothetical protein C0599_02230 [Salinivirgaceae bacterium]|nr:MAG: hypothetical protein C0599_02230 [Salinivirgaceae bacterium]